MIPLARASPAEQHRNSGAEHWRPKRRERSRDHLCARRPRSQRARDTCVLACWNMVIPYLCPDLPRKAEGSARLRSESSTRVHERVDTQLAVVQKIGRERSTLPRKLFRRRSCWIFPSAWANTNLRGTLRAVLVASGKSAVQSGLPLASSKGPVGSNFSPPSFATFERNIREPARRDACSRRLRPCQDIQAITVNRWPHGYAYEYNSLYDPDWPDGSPLRRLAGSRSDASRLQILMRKHSPIPTRLLIRRIAPSTKSRASARSQLPKWPGSGYFSPGRWVTGFDPPPGSRDLRPPADSPSSSACKLEYA